MAAVSSTLKERQKPWTWQRVVSRTILYGLLILLALYFLMPIYILVITSLKPYARVDYTKMWELTL